MKVVVDPAAGAEAAAATAAWMQADLGPQITARAKLYCPVDTGTLRSGIHQEEDGLDLIVAADRGGRDNRSIAAYLELGHRVFHPSTGEVGPEWVLARPFLLGQPCITDGGPAQSALSCPSNRLPRGGRNSVSAVTVADLRATRQERGAAPDLRFRYTVR